VLLSIWMSRARMRYICRADQPADHDNGTRADHCALV
jgi:hypothetical protein